MAIKQTLEDSKARIDALLAFANQKTGAADVSLGDAVKTLADGYGGGGNLPENMEIIEYTPTETSQNFTITHNLGKIPRFVAIFPKTFDNIIAMRDSESTSKSLVALVASRIDDGVVSKSGSGCAWWFTSTRASNGYTDYSTSAVRIEFLSSSIRTYQTSSNALLDAGQTYMVIIVA